MAAAGTVSSASPIAGQGAPTSNFVGDAGQAVDADKMNALTAIAQQGSKAANVYGTTQANLGAQKTAAVTTALARAGLAGAPAANRGANVATVSAPVTNYQGLAANQAANYAQNNANTGNAFGQYFDLTKAGLPVANAALQTTIANDQEKAAEKAMSDNLSLSTKQLANELAQQKLGIGTTPDVTTDVTKLGGSLVAGQDINQQATGLEGPGTPGIPGAPATAATGGSSGGLPGGMPNLVGGGGAPVVAPGTQAAPGTAPIHGTPATSQAQAYAIIDAQHNWPPGTAQNLATNAEAPAWAKGIAAQKAAAVPPTSAAVLANPKNATTVNQALALAQGQYKQPNGKAGVPMTSSQIQSALISQGVDPYTASVIANSAASATTKGG